MKIVISCVFEIHPLGILLHVHTALNVFAIIIYGGINGPR